MKRFVTGQARGQATLFPERLDDFIAKDNPVRVVEVFVETLDGIRVPLYASIGLPADIASAAASGAEGVGLYRTEYSFLLSDTLPGEDDQRASYREVLAAFAPRPVTLRTLDVGGDKMLSFFPTTEDNPFLGCRGIRFSLDRSGPTT